MRKCNPAGPTAKVRGDRVHQVRVRRMPDCANGAHYTGRLVAYGSPRFPTLEWTKAWGHVRARVTNGQSGLTGCEFNTMQCNCLSRCSFEMNARVNEGGYKANVKCMRWMLGSWALCV